MEVETFEQVEILEDGSFECKEEVTELLEELELEGQKKIDTDAGRVPFRKMTAKEWDVYSKVLASHTDLKEYKDDPIPFRVLKLIKAAKALIIDDKPFFHHYKVLHQPPADFRDPVLIGIHGGQYSGDRYLLARWGEELKSFAEFIPAAITIRRKEIESELKKIATEYRSCVQNYATLADNEVLDANIPSFYS